MKALVLCMALLTMGTALGQVWDQSFPVIKVTTSWGETFSVLDATVSYGPPVQPRATSGILVERDGRIEEVPLDQVLAMSLVEPGESTHWYIVLASGEVLEALPGELRVSGTVGPDSTSHSGYISVGITPDDGPSQNYVSVVFPTDATP